MDSLINYLVRERYAVRRNGEPVEHSYEDVIRRVVEWYGKDPNDLLSRRILIPATPVLMNAGSPTKHPCYFSCFPLGKVGDSLDEIMETASLMARIYRSGGGCGVDVSDLRQKGAEVANGQGKASGPVSFLQIFDSVTGTVSQGGRRRGALMIQCDARHPDAFEFAQCKAEEGRYANMNISLNVRDGDLDDPELLRVVAEGMWRNGEPGVIFIDNHLRNSVIPPSEDPIYVNPCLKRGTLLFDGDKMVPIEQGGKTFKSWKTGIKPIVRLTLSSGAYIDVTEDHKILTDAGWVEAAKITETMVVFTTHPHRKINNVKKDDSLPTWVKSDIDNYDGSYVSVRCTSKQSLGKAEVWDFTMYDGKPYNYAQGFIVHNCAEYMSVAKTACNLLTLNLVEMLEPGMAEIDFMGRVFECAKEAVRFGNYVLDQDEGYPTEEIRRVSQKWRPVGVGVTGLYEVMMWFGIASEDRPRFAREMQASLWTGGRTASQKLCKERKYKPVELVNLVFNERALKADEVFGYDDRWLDCSEQANCYVAVQAPTGTTSLFGRVGASGIEPLFDLPMKRMVKDGDDWKEFEVLPRIYQEDFVKRVGPAKVGMDQAEEWLARNIPLEEHLAILEAIQDFCDAAISKTINVGHDTTKEEIEEMLRGVERRGIKSFTLYRDGSRQLQVLNKHKTESGGGDVGRARRYRVRGPQTCYIHVTEVEGKPVEAFVTAGKGGTILHADNEAIGRLVSLVLCEAPELGEKLCRHLEGIDAGMMYFCDDLHGKSVQDILAQILLRDYFSEAQPEGGLGVCPECGRMTLKREGGCSKCTACTYSSC